VTRKQIWIEVLVLYLGSCAVIRGIKAIVDGGVLSNDWLVLVALVFLYTPVAAEKWNGYRMVNDVVFPEPMSAALWKAMKWLGVLVLIIYPAFLIGYHVLQTEGFHWFTSDILGMRRPYPRFLPENSFTGPVLVTLGMQALYQVLCVGYAEEFFYRGYMQTRLDELYPAKWTLFGASFGWALPITAILFTIGHSLVTLQWWQPFIVFPALVFGWLRARTGMIFAGAAFHAFANTMMIVLDHIYGLSVLEATTLGDLVQDLKNLVPNF
jgi:uncharacterized protein